MCEWIEDCGRIGVHSLHEAADRAQGLKEEGLALLARTADLESIEVKDLDLSPSFWSVPPSSSVHVNHSASAVHITFTVTRTVVLCSDRVAQVALLHKASGLDLVITNTHLTVRAGAGAGAVAAAPACAAPAPLPRTSRRHRPHTDCTQVAHASNGHDIPKCRPQQMQQVQSQRHRL